MTQRSPMYQWLASESEFQAFVRDMLGRTGLSDGDLLQLLGPTNAPKMDPFGEFAKCFVPKFVDPIHNYEFYEFMGDSAVNKATISYLYRKVSTRLSKKGDPRALGYLDKLKSATVSTTFLSNICEQLGFNVYLDQVIQRGGGKYDISREKNYKEDVVEAFFGCMEVQIDTIYMFRGYCFVSNIMVDILDNAHIDYRPTSLWTPSIILKETNDAIRKAAQPTSSFSERDRAKLREYKIDRAGQGFTIKSKLATSQAPFQDDRQFQQRRTDSKEVSELTLSHLVLQSLSQDPLYRNLIRNPPSPEELGIQDLVR